MDETHSGKRGYLRVEHTTFTNLAHMTSGHRTGGPPGNKQGACNRRNPGNFFSECYALNVSPPTSAVLLNPNPQT